MLAREVTALVHGEDGLAGSRARPASGRSTTTSQLRCVSWRGARGACPRSVLPPSGDAVGRSWRVLKDAGIVPSTSRGRGELIQQGAIEVESPAGCASLDETLVGRPVRHQGRQASGLSQVSRATTS